MSDTGNEIYQMPATIAAWFIATVLDLPHSVDLAVSVLTAFVLSLQIYLIWRKLTAPEPEPKAQDETPNPTGNEDQANPQ